MWGGPRAGSEVSLLAQSTATTAATPVDVPAQTPLEPGEQLDGVTALIHADGPVAGRTIQVGRPRAPETASLMCFYSVSLVCS